MNNPAGPEPKARVTYTASWPDAVGRSVASVDYGTNGGTTLVRPATVPTRSDIVLVTSNAFDDAGRTSVVTDPAGTMAVTEYDAADRRTRLIENFIDGVVSAAAPDEDRTTRRTYTPDGAVATLTAVNPATGDQVTTYVYGTTLADSGIARSDLLQAEVYPDSTGGSDRIKYAYNRQSKRTETTDQAGTVRAFDYDKLGRPTQDRVTTLGSGVEGAVRRIETTYEVRGLPATVTSYDNPTVGSGNIINEVWREYNDFAQLVTEYQAHAGAVNTGTSPKVQYGYADGSDNTIRPMSITYPDGRVLDYDYGTAGGSDDVAGRMASITDGTTQLVGYAYLGAGTIVETDYQEPDLRYRLFDPSASGDIYTGLDRFGRVIACRWEDYGSSNDAVQIRYGYDRVSNRLWREDAVAAASGKPFDELYAYDGLYRLADMQRGTLNTQKDAITSPTFGQQWLLDATGNWDNFKQDDDGNGTWDLNQNRTANSVNEITDITETAAPSWSTPAYSPTGNMTTMPQPAAPTASYTAVYDAWNRLIRLVYGANTVQENAYDGLRRRTVRNDYLSGSLNETRHFFYSVAWQVLEERLNASLNPDRQFVWGIRYIDDIVCRDHNTNTDSTLDERLYALQDANWNVVALTNTTGDVQERYAYQPYGEPLFLDAAFVAKTASSFDWATLYCGYWYDSRTGLYLVRNRALLSALGMWMQRDPIGYADGMNLYAAYFVLGGVDPSGLDSIYRGFTIGVSAYKGVGGGLAIEYKRKTEPCCVGGVAGAKTVYDLRLHGEVGLGLGIDVKLATVQLGLEFTVATINVDAGGACSTPCAAPGAPLPCCRYCTDIGVNIPVPVAPVRSVSIGLFVGFDVSATTSGSFRICYSFPGCPKPGLAVGFCGSVSVEASASIGWGVVGAQADVTQGCVALHGTESMLNW